MCNSKAHPSDKINENSALRSRITGGFWINREHEISVRVINGDQNKRGGGLEILVIKDDILLSM